MLHKDKTFFGAVAAIVAVVLFFVGGITFLIGGTWSSTDASSMTCVYNGGPIDSKDYRGYQEPGEGRAYQGWISNTYNVPVSVRQYRISMDPTQGDTETADNVSVRVKGYNMAFEPTVTFTINTAVIDGKPISCDFIEKQLRPFGVENFSPGGEWRNYLNERLRPIVNDSMTRTLQDGYDPGALKFNTNGERDKAALEVGKDLTATLARQWGGDYFCSSTYQFGQSEESCGNISVILPSPNLSADDEAQLAKPQRARIDADNDIAAADESARKAEQVAEARELEAASAQRKADADEKIANENARVQTAQATLDYAWCQYLVTLDQNCALVKAAESGDFPSVISSDGIGVVVPLPSPSS